MTSWLRRGVTAGLLIASAAAAAAQTGGAAEPFADCDPNLESCAFAHCVAMAAWQSGRFVEGGALLGERFGDPPDEPCVASQLGRLAFGHDPGRAARLLRQAAEGFLEQGNAYQETWARIALADLHRGQADFTAAENQLARAADLAEGLDDVTPLLMVRIKEALVDHDQGKNLLGALRSLRQIEEAVRADGYYLLLYDFLNAVYSLSARLGLYDGARVAHEEILELARTSGNRLDEILARYNMIFTTLEMRPSAEAMRAEVEEILAGAVEVDAREIETAAHYLLARWTRGAESRGHLDRCLELSSELGSSLWRSLCLQTSARRTAESDPAAARDELRAGVDAALDTPADPWPLVFGAVDRMRVHWQTRSPIEAYEASLEVLADIERLRDLQTDPNGRAQLFTTWTDAYAWLAGKVLDSAGEDLGPEVLERSFAVFERLRSRVLLDALEGAREPAAEPPSSAGARAEPNAEPSQRQEILAEIVRIQRRLLDPDLTPEERLAELGRRDRAEDELSQLVAAEHPDYAALRDPDYASLADVQELLADDEAFLSFQTGHQVDVYGDYGGGSWLLVTTRDGSRRYRLPGRQDLPASDVLRGLVERRAGFSAAPAVDIYDQLLRRPLDELPAGVRKLVIIPDGKLHLLPFGLLRASTNAETLAVRYTLSAAPSATLWRRWRRSERAAASAPVLALGAPTLPTSGEASRAAEAHFRSWSDLGFWDVARGLQPLAAARWEVRAATRHLGGPSRRLIGDQASEASLKREVARGAYQILHFATHALINNQRPELSAILLSPGSESEDGLLQFREIVELDLSGRVVVLSTCRSASGALLEGEGVMSLARAFFQAGARNVVGSLWPLRDDEAAELFDAFYRHLGRGTSVAQALAAAQQERIQAGAPAAAWAGLVVLGDGDFVPLPGGKARTLWPGEAWLTLVGGVMAALLLLSWTRHRRQGRAAPLSG